MVAFQTTTMVLCHSDKYGFKKKIHIKWSISELLYERSNLAYFFKTY